MTALFNGPLIVLIAWAMGKPMDLNFEIFMIGLLLLSILVVGNFLRDGESNWLEGALLVVSHICEILGLFEAYLRRLFMSSSLLRVGIIPTLTSPPPTISTRQSSSTSS